MIVTVARDEGLHLRVAAALRDSAWDVPALRLSSVGEVENLLASAASPNAFVVGPDIGLQGAIDVVGALSNARISVPVFLVAAGTTEILRGAMRAGIRDVLSPEFDPADLLGAFEDAHVRASGPPSLPGLTVAVFSTKGGVGTSVVASNLAVRLGASTKQPVTLLDLDLASADQSIMHGLSPRWTIQDAADGAVGLDRESLAQLLVEIPNTRVRLLPGPVDPALAETITAANVGSVIAACRAEAPIAVLDTASSFDDRTLAALDAADVIVVVSSLDVAALRALTVSLQTLERLGVADETIEIAVVRSDSKSGLTIGDIERAISRQVDLGLPSMRAVPRSVNEGVPLAVSSLRSGVIQALDGLVDRLVGQASEVLEPPDVDGGNEGFLSSILPWSRSEPRADETSKDDPANGEAVRAPAEAGERVLPSTDHPRSEVAAAEAGGEDLGTDEREAQVVRLPNRSDDRARQIRRVQRRREQSTPPGVADSGPSSVPEAGPDLEGMPPPIVVEDDDDQPRRRRR